MFLSVKESISQIRREYSRQALSRRSVSADPIDQLRKWLDEAIGSEVWDPTAMTLATAGRDGRPAARTVLLKEITREGPLFYTNYNSRKARHLEENPHAALVLYWPELERQIRMEGRIEQVSTEKSAQYFHSRPRRSQLAAWASQQSQVIPGRGYLEKRMDEFTQSFYNQPITRPPHWGGYLVKVQRFEFWQGRRNRLHDRIEYLLDPEGWIIQRLSP